MFDLIGEPQLLGDKKHIQAGDHALEWWRADRAGASPQEILVPQICVQWACWWSRLKIPKHIDLCGLYFRAESMQISIVAQIVSQRIR